MFYHYEHYMSILHITLIVNIVHTVSGSQPVSEQWPFSVFFFFCLFFVFDLFFAFIPLITPVKEHVFHSIFTYFSKFLLSRMTGVYLYKNQAAPPTKEKI